MPGRRGLRPQPDLMDGSVVRRLGRLVAAQR